MEEFGRSWDQVYDLAKYVTVLHHSLFIDNKSRLSAPDESSEIIQTHEVKLHFGSSSNPSHLYIHSRAGNVQELAVAAVCDRRLRCISTTWSALIERRYNFFTPPVAGGEEEIVTKLTASVFVLPCHGPRFYSQWRISLVSDYPIRRSSMVVENACPFTSRYTWRSVIEIDISARRWSAPAISSMNPGPNE